ncbi:hypothetical protein FA95DRAFT_780080 [Auriscalpium vulgare]|uniref:Uncharacterized protein n=1 Tax=Auriscalpium vulgare TaxID=40419 RepID=A0ACB8S182_9AGAM|nr:hypothetical protein FA95DRAFT_780080 [Auriscalpium vulgare]
MLNLLTIRVEPSSQRCQVLRQCAQREADDRFLLCHLPHISSHHWHRHLRDPSYILQAAGSVGFVPCGSSARSLPPLALPQQRSLRSDRYKEDEHIVLHMYTTPGQQTTFTCRTSLLTRNSATPCRGYQPRPFAVQRCSRLATLLLNVDGHICGT